MLCLDCFSETPRRGATQKYCLACSEKNDLKRKNIYQITKGKALLSAEHEGWKAVGTEISGREKLSLFKSLPREVGLCWYNRVALPFSWSGSKNHIFTNTARGHVFMRDQARAYRAELTARIARSVDLADVRQNKLWIDIFVQKPNHRGDATNFVDMVCDAIKDAILLDDRWFSVRSVDWQIVKDQPMLYVGLGQESAEDLQPCSTCGRLLTFDNFGKNKAAANGIGRVCNDCRLTQRRRRQARLASEINEDEGLFG